jgi:hypothetical protein
MDSPIPRPIVLLQSELLQLMKKTAIMPIISR